MRRGVCCASEQWLPQCREIHSAPDSSSDILITKHATAGKLAAPQRKGSKGCVLTLLGLFIAAMIS